MDLPVLSNHTHGVTTVSEIKSDLSRRSLGEGGQQ